MPSNRHVFEPSSRFRDLLTNFGDDALVNGE